MKLIQALLKVNKNCIEVIDSYEVSVNLLSEYVDNLDSYQRKKERLPDSLQILLEPQTLDPDEFETLRKAEHILRWKISRFNGQALLPQRFM